MTFLLVQKPLPDEGEVVLIKINKIMPFGAYCTLTEYNIDAYLPINEVAAGWIKNIHEFIKEGQSDVAKVIFVDKEKRAVDISLKKVTTKEKKDKLNEYGQERRAMLLFKQALNALGKVNEEKAIVERLSSKFSTYSDVLDAAYAGEPSLKSILGAELFNSLHEIAVKNMKPKVYGVSYKAEIMAKNKVGNINKIKEALLEIEKQGVKVIYEGAPHYIFKAEDETYPKAEAKIKKAQSLLDKHSELVYTLSKES